jgi:CMP-N-acetylneuraminic acid synthetase
MLNSVTNPLPSWTAIIPLRAGSKGLPGKNILPLNGKPLYHYALDAALAAGATRVLISTDIPEVLQAKHPETVVVVPRPLHLCGDTVDMSSLLLHLISSQALIGTLALLQATSPLRTVAHIQAGLALFETRQHDLVITVTPGERSVLKWGFLDAAQGSFTPISEPKYCFSNRQQLPEIVRPNGALYVFDANWFASNGGFVTDRIGALSMSAHDSLDIDNAADFADCAIALQQKNTIKTHSS